MGLCDYRLWWRQWRVSCILWKSKNRLHIGFDDPSHAVGTDEFIRSEFIRVRDEIKEEFL